jgi:hypothetical protein
VIDWRILQSYRSQDLVRSIIAKDSIVFLLLLSHVFLRSSTSTNKSDLARPYMQAMLEFQVLALSAPGEGTLIRR